MNNRMLMTRQERDDVATRTEDAYSFDRYKSWSACAIVLQNLGYNSLETEAILRSKHMRWAADCSNKPYGKATSSDLLRYIKEPKHKFNQAEVDSLVRGTF